jgi:hypothetical protein
MNGYNPFFRLRSTTEPQTIVQAVSNGSHPPVQSGQLDL